MQLPAADEKGETVPVSDDEADGEAQVCPVLPGGWSSSSIL